MNADERLDALTAAGGIQVCGNAQNCVAVCPKEIPADHFDRQGGLGHHDVFAEEVL